MTITVGTANFIGLLADGIQTADDSGELPFGIHVATHRGGYGDEPGRIDLLAATSTDRYVIGHGFIPIEGQIIPSVWPVDSVKTVIAVCKNLLAARGKEHTVDIEVVGAADSEGLIVTLVETPALFDTDTEFQFSAEPEKTFPLTMVWNCLTGNISDANYRETHETGWSAHVLAAVTAVAKRQKETMWWWSTPNANVHRVSIGGCWLGAAMPVKLPPGESLSGPSVEPLLSPPDDAASELRQTLAEMKADGITVTVDNPRGPVAQTLAAAINEADQ